MEGLILGEGVGGWRGRVEEGRGGCEGGGVKCWRGKGRVERLSCGGVECWRGKRWVDG